ncbi:hypothetical protein V6N13_071994 [Hibiscus sabdariffa]
MRVVRQLQYYGGRSFLNTALGIKLTLDPRSHNALPMKLSPTEQEIMKLPGLSSSLVGQSGSCDVVLKIATLSASIHCCQVIDDKGDASIETTGPAQAEISAGLQILAERLAVLSAYP